MNRINAGEVHWPQSLVFAEFKKRDAELAAKDARIETLEQALHRISQWAKAYPLDVFPEPDFKKVHEVLSAAGLSLDQVSASNMRHVITQVQQIADSAISL